MKKSEVHPRHLWDIIKQTITHIIEVPEPEEERKEQKAHLNK